MHADTQAYNIIIAKLLTTMWWQALTDYKGVQQGPLERKKKYL